MNMRRPWPSDGATRGGLYFRGSSTHRLVRFFGGPTRLSVTLLFLLLVQSLVHAQTIALPTTNIFRSTTNVSLPVVTSTIDPTNNFIGFRGEFTFDETVVTFQDPPVSGAGMTAGNNWIVSGIVLPEKGPIRTLSVVISSNDATPLSGEGTLFSLNLIRVSQVLGATSFLFWTVGPPPDDLVFIDGKLNLHPPDNAVDGSLTVALEAINLSGHISACSGSPGPVQNVTVTLTGSSSGSVLSSNSGNYLFPSLASSGTYTITPSKAPREAGSLGGSEGIDMVDVIAILRHVLHFGPPLSGCRLTAADVNGDNLVNTIDLMAVLQFYLGGTADMANVGQYSFTPANRTYSGTISNQTGQNFDAVVFGDVAAPFGDQTAFFDPNANNLVKTMVRQTDGKLLIGGYFTTLSPNGGVPVARNRIARLNANGSLDSTFDPDANGAISSIALQPDGRILVGGFFTGIGGQTRNHIARLNPNGTLDSEFNPDANGNVFAIVVRPTDGAILVSGWFTTVSGQPHKDIVRLDSATGEPDSFAPNLEGLDDRPSVSTMLAEPDGSVLLGGYFSSLIGQSCRNIARLNTDGTPDSDFHPVLTGADHYGDVFAVALQSDGKIVLGGAFTTVEGFARKHIARVDPATGAPDTFDPDASNSFDPILAVAVQDDGMILAGGNFTSYAGENSIGGQVRNYIVRLDPITGLADSFDPNPDSPVVSLLVQPDGRTLTGGGFTNMGGQSRNCIALLDFGTGLAGRITLNSGFNRKITPKPVADPCTINYITAVRAGLKCE